MPQIPDLLTMLQSGVHFGHQLSRWNPKMKPYIFTQKNGFHIINLEETQVKLAGALSFVEATVAAGGTLLFVATKKQAVKVVKEAAISCEMPYITQRWLGGTLTNFSAIHKLIKKYRDLKQQKATGELAKYTKKEQLEFSKEIDRLDRIVGGISEINKVPDAIFIIDIKKEKTALNEARKKKIPIIAMCDTNVDPNKVSYSIPANDDAIKSITLITNLVAQAAKEGLAKREKTQAVSAKPVAAKAKSTQASAA